MTRRQVLQSLTATGVGLVTGFGAYGAAYERHRLTLVVADVPVSGLPPALDGLRIGLLTDVHHSTMVSAHAVTEAVTMLQQSSPDLVALGGDYVTYGDRGFVEPVAERLSPLAATPHGAYAVLGNHDDDTDMPRALAANGLAVLKDQRTTLSVRGERLDIAGIRYWTRQPRELARVVRGTGPTTLLLAHDPRRVAEAALLDVQLVLSGHTHGGQVVVPGIGAFASRRFPVLSGLATTENTSLFVSRGVGTVYLPVRLNCPPDVAMLTLRRRSDI